MCDTITSVTGRSKDRQWEERMGGKVEVVKYLLYRCYEIWLQALSSVQIFSSYIFNTIEICTAIVGHLAMQLYVFT